MDRNDHTPATGQMLKRTRLLVYLGLVLAAAQAQGDTNASINGVSLRDGWLPLGYAVLAMWNDFQARMDWCVQPYAKANHPPRAALNGDTSDAILELAAKPGEVLKFNASDSTDSDQDALRYAWWIYPEAGRQPYGKALPLENATADRIQFTVPADAAGRELHLILEVWDQSTTVPLVDCRRAVISVAK